MKSSWTKTDLLILKEAIRRGESLGKKKRGALLSGLCKRHPFGTVQAYLFRMKQGEAVE